MAQPPENPSPVPQRNTARLFDYRCACGAEHTVRIRRTGTERVDPGSIPCPKGCRGPDGKIRRVFWWRVRPDTWRKPDTTGIVFGPKDDEAGGGWYAHGSDRRDEHGPGRPAASSPPLASRYGIVRTLGPTEGGPAASTAAKVKHPLALVPREQLALGEDFEKPKKTKQPRGRKAPRGDKDPFK